MWELEIYAAVTVHDNQGREEMIQKIRALGVEPRVLDSGDRIEIRYQGNRETVWKMVKLCEDSPFHDIRVYRPEH